MYQFVAIRGIRGLCGIGAVHQEIKPRWHQHTPVTSGHILVFVFKYVFNQTPSPSTLHTRKPPLCCGDLRFVAEYPKYSAYKTPLQETMVIEFRRDL